MPFLVAGLGLDDYGRWVLMWTTAQSVPVLGTHWLEAAVIRFGHLQDPAVRSTVAVAGRIAVVLSVVLGAIVAAIVIPGADAADVVATACLTGAVGWYLVAAADLVSDHRFGRYSTIAVVRSGGGSVAAIAAGAVTGDPRISIGAAAAAHVIAAVGSGAGWLTAPGPLVGGSLRKLLAFGLPSAALSGASIVTSVADRFVLAAARPLAVVGTYSALYLLIDLPLRLIPTALASVARPTVFRWWDAGDTAQASAFVGRLTALVAATGAIAASGIAAVAAVGLRAAGGEWAGAMGVVALLLAGLYLQALVVPANIIFAASGKQWAAGRNMALAAVLNVTINIFLIPSYGIIAAGFATALAYAVLLVLTLRGTHSMVLEVVRSPTILAVTLAASAGLVPVLALLGFGFPTLIVVAAATAHVIVTVVLLLTRPGRPIMETLFGEAAPRPVTGREGS